MRSALLCVFFALAVHKEGGVATDEDFRPTPIPLNDWNSGREGKAGGAGTLHEIIATDEPPVIAAVPAHYWEDALRHSVYLTLVRDKIDQLIAKGSVITPDGEPDQIAQKDDDHDLWEKIKTAPFDRLTAEEPANLGDITIMSKGRLLEEQNGLRFAEDEMSKEKCNDEKCMEGIKAYWSVKRVRQRDAETTPGKYHYELTFSVSSQISKKQKKPYENPVRTFTVREGTPVERPHYRTHEQKAHAPRPQRAVWFHKNIVPTQPHQSRKQEQGLDRLFSSWFSDDEGQAKRYKQVSYVPQMYPQRSKVGHVGASIEQHHQKPPMMPYQYKPQPQSSYKFSRLPIGPPPVSHTHTQHHYIDLDAIRNQNQFSPPSQNEYKYLPSNIVKTTKPAVLPTPPISYAPSNTTVKISQNMNETETTTRDPEIITAFTMYSKPKPQPTKVSYFHDHVRPPVFNAPPGVFVTMDKKPFKPMPPLKYMHSFKPNKNKPIDFRPSPQVLDVQFSDPDPLSDAFRPIAMGYGSRNTTESNEQVSSHRDKPSRKSKPPKKHENIKSHRVTTSAPEIITAHNEVLEEMHWANILGAFVKTTPMVSHKMNFSETTTPIPSTTVSSTITVKSTPRTVEPVSITTTAVTTTLKPRRTRPPPKFTKPVKVKKHKRITSTTTTSTTTTTEKPHHKRPSHDLTPQASSASTGTTKSWQTQNVSVTTTPTGAYITNVSETTTTPEPLITTTKIIPTTYRALTTTRQKTTTTDSLSTTTGTTTTVSTVSSKDRNRFRQSTLMNKGTSVNHDKWSSPYAIDKNKTMERPKSSSSVSGKYPPRRKGSNFQGYVSSTPKTVEEERHRQQHIDHAFNPNLNVISLSSTAETVTEPIPITTPNPTQATYEESAEQNEHELEDSNGTEDPDEGEDTEEPEDESESNEQQETKDHDEYIFDTSLTGTSQDSETEEKTNEVEPEIATTTEKTVVTSAHSVPKNKTKCNKKKKNQLTASNQTSNPAGESENEISVAPIATTTEKLSTAEFFNQIFGMTVDQNEKDGNRTDSKYVDNDEDLEEFLESINGNGNQEKDSNETNDDDYESEEKDENENSPFNNDEENRFARHADPSYEDYQDRPYSFLELMAME